MRTRRALEWSSAGFCRRYSDSPFGFTVAKIVDSFAPGGASMKFGVLALDYDGTIATDGVLFPEVRSAIAEARVRGIVVIIATGRILSDLRSLCGDLSFVDAVVAENGAVLAFPNGHTRILGRLPPQIFFDALQRRGVAFRSGQCIVEAEASA